MAIAAHQLITTTIHIGFHVLRNILFVNDKVFDTRAQQLQRWPTVAKRDPTLLLRGKVSLSVWDLESEPHIR